MDGVDGGLATEGSGGIAELEQDSIGTAGWDVLELGRPATRTRTAGLGRNPVGERPSMGGDGDQDRAWCIGLSGDGKGGGVALTLDYLEVLKTAGDSEWAL